MKQFGSFQFDTQNECLWHDGRQIALKPKPFSVLRYLVENPQRLVTHDELLDALWPETYVQPQVLRTYVLELRKLLDDDAGNPRFIATVPKRGYRFLADVSEPAAPPTSPARASLLVGREGELELLRSLLAKARRGERQVAFVTGDAGIGKTALLDEFCREVSGVAAARGQCIESFAGREPFFAVLEMLVELMSGADPASADQRRKAFAAAAPGWSSGPGLRSTASTSTDIRSIDGDPTDKGSHAGKGQTGKGQTGKGAGAGSNDTRSLNELCNGIEAAARIQPLLLILEDLQWSDPATLDFISALARRRTPASLLLIGSFRAAEAVSNPALRQIWQDLTTRRLCSIGNIEPLKESSVAEYLTRDLVRRSDGAIPPDLASFVHQQSEGNPLFMIATLEHLIAQRLLSFNAVVRAWQTNAPLPDVDVGVPADLCAMIESQIEQCADRDQRLLEAGSIVGTVFAVWAAAAVLDMNPVVAEEEFESLARKTHLLHTAGHDELPDGSRSTFYALPHRLHREVLYRRQPEARRSRSHQRFAEHLGTLFAGREERIAPELAHHFEAAGDWKRAADALVMVADSAVARQSGSEAAAVLTHALELLQNVESTQREAREASLQERIARLPTALHTAEN